MTLSFDRLAFRLRQVPPREILPKVLRRAVRLLLSFLRGLRDLCRPTFLSTARSWGDPRALLPPGFPPEEVSFPEGALCAELSDLLAHRFDLLGSGPQSAAYGAEAPGIEGVRYSPSPAVLADPEGRWLSGFVNRANLAEARRRWRLVSPGYEPLDWQRDFKSGYRWDSRIPSRRIRYGNAPGADVKVPWELSRLQHLPRLALAYGCARRGKGNFGAAQRILTEIRNQILDFTAVNPPGFGVCWACPMDAAIRAANISLVFDLLSAAGAALDAPFRRILATSLLEHARFLRRNLEWDPQLRGNHYLADLAGLIFAASHLPDSPEREALLDFSVPQLVREVELQFHEEGSNFEASTAYHRLSAETAGFALALGAGVRGACAVSPQAAARLWRAAEFARGYTRPDGLAVQVGDNDSGRFFRLDPSEEPMDHRSLPPLLEALFTDALSKGKGALEAALVRAWRGGNRLPQPEPASPNPRRSWPEFGLFRLEAGGFTAWVRLGPVGQRGNGGHAHNDLLSLEVCFAGEPFLADPGTYLYTPFPEVRNAFRSAAVHATLHLPGIEPNTWLAGPQGLFSLVRTAPFRVLEISPAIFCGEHQGWRAPHRRTVELSEEVLRVRDECPLEVLKRIVLPLDPAVGAREEGDSWILRRGKAALRLFSAQGSFRRREGWYSPGYGRKLPATVLVLETAVPSAEWFLVPERCKKLA